MQFDNLIHSGLGVQNPRLWDISWPSEVYFPLGSVQHIPFGSVRILYSAVLLHGEGELICLPNQAKWIEMGEASLLKQTREASSKDEKKHPCWGAEPLQEALLLRLRVIRSICAI